MHRSAPKFSTAIAEPKATDGAIRPEDARDVQDFPDWLGARGRSPTTYATSGEAVRAWRRGAAVLAQASVRLTGNAVLHADASTVRSGCVEYHDARLPPVVGDVPRSGARGNPDDATFCGCPGAAMMNDQACRS